MTTRDQEGGLDNGVMWCFRANCFCDNGTTSFIPIGFHEKTDFWTN